MAVESRAIEDREPVSAPRRPPRALGRAARLLAGFSGALTVAMVLLAVVVLGAKLVVGATQGGGPGIGTVVVHLLAALVCVLLQRFADRHTGSVRTWCATAVVVITAAVLALYWWF